MGRKSPCDQHYEEILSRLDRQESVVSIADALGLSRHALGAYLLRRGIHSQRPRSTPRKIDEDRLRHLLEQGATQERIAELLCVSRSAIGRRAQLLGLQTARTGPRSGHDHPQWLGGRCLQKHGYIGIYAPLHPHANASNGKVQEHRLVMECVIGRYLKRREVVDHRDGHPWHNWPENLALYACNADHLRAELSGRAKASPRRSIPGAYGSNQKLPHCPSEHETLALCPSGIRERLAEHIAIHRPTNAHQTLQRRSFLRQGAIREPFQWASTE